MSYQVGNYVKVRDLDVARITKISEDFIWFTTEFGLKTGLPLSEVKPVSLSPQIVEKIGFIKSREKKNSLHTEYCYYLTINNKMFYLRGLKFRNDFKWSILNLTLTYIHQLQNYFKLVDENIQFNMFEPSPIKEDVMTDLI